VNGNVIEGTVATGGGIRPWKATRWADVASSVSPLRDSRRAVSTAGRTITSSGVS
jgi:hypothetical protein